MAQTAEVEQTEATWTELKMSEVDAPAVSSSLAKLLAVIPTEVVTVG